MWVISSFDRITDKLIKLIRGHDLARNISYLLDRLANRMTGAFDVFTSRPLNSYRQAHSVEGAPEASISDVNRARLFRRKYVLPRRRLAKREDGALHWQRLEPGEDTARSRTYQECDVPLSSLTEFGDGWVLYFWTLKLLGFVSVFALLLAAPAWHEANKRWDSVKGHDTNGILNWALSNLGSAECTEHMKVCLNEQCSELDNKHICPKPHRAHALSCILVVALYAMLIINLRWTQSKTSDYVKSLEAKNGLNTEDFSIMVENPPVDAVDPDEWERFFSQFGKVAYVSVAKDDGDIVWKVLEARMLILQLYRDNPAALSDRITVLSDDDHFSRARVHSDDVGKMSRGAQSFSSSVTKDDVVLKRFKQKHGEEAEEVDAGDADADGSADDTLVAMAPWYTGGHLCLTTDWITQAKKLETETAESSGALKYSTLKNPFAKLRNPYVFWRWMRFEFKQAFPYLSGTLSQQDRDMLSERLFVECPKELKEELKQVDEGKQYNAVRVFVTFETVKGRRECLDAMTAGGRIRAFFDWKRNDIPDSLKFRGDTAGSKILVVTEPPAPEQMIWWNLKVSFCQRFTDDIFALFITSILICVAYYVALWSSISAEQEKSKNTPQYSRSFLFSIWAQIFNQMCTTTFGWLASQEHHHDEDAKQLSLLLRYSLLKCITSIIFIVVTPREKTLYYWNIAAMKTMLYADAVVGPAFRYIDPFSLIKRFLSRFIPNQPLMDWVHLSPAHDIADSYSNIVKTVFLGLFVLALVPSSPILTSLACLTGYWVDKHAICRVWSCHAHSKPAKYTAEAVQNLLAIALVTSMMKTIQLYKDWPFDNLCQTGTVIKTAEVWEEAGAHDENVWGQCTEYTSTRSSIESLALYASPEPWMSLEHARAIRIYSIGSIIITVTLSIYFWARSTLNLVSSLFCTHTVPVREDEEKLPTFTDGGSRYSAYIPQVKDSNFMFPLLATDLTLMDCANIPWHCNYELTNLARDIGGEATRKGLARAFSAVKRYSNSEVSPIKKQGLNRKSSDESFDASVCSEDR